MNSLIKDISVNNALGKLILLILLLVFPLLEAKNFDYKVQVDKKTPYVKEAVILYFDINQSNHNIVLLFDFDILKSSNYTAQRIDIQEQDAYHNVSIRYTYLLYPLQSGKIDIGFRLTQRTTSDDSVAYSFSGDRDNVKGLETKDSRISIPPLSLQVKPLPKGTKLVGDFTLTTQIKTHTAQAYEPIPLQVSIKGLGYPPMLKSLLPKDTVFTQFSEKPKNQSTTSKKGTENIVSYTMALSHDQNFSLESINILAFNPLLEKSYVLNIEKQDFSIKTKAIHDLLDTIDTPQPMQVAWQGIETFLSYLFVFILGYILAYLKINRFWLSKEALDKNALLKLKITKTSTYKALLQVLMAQKDRHNDFSSIIKKLEAVCYHTQSISLHILKKEAQEILDV